MTEIQAAALPPAMAGIYLIAQALVLCPTRELATQVAGELRRLALTNTAVLDEADRMLDTGFADDIASIVDLTPTSRQTLLFSAT